MENMAVYVSALQDSLRRKLDVLKRLLALTGEQGEILAQESPDMDRFDDIIGQKSQLLRTMATLDRGFESFFARISDALKQDRYLYQTQIVEMQNLIRAITDTGLQIEGQERRNKTAFQEYLAGARREIRSSKASSRMVSSYHQNMANPHLMGQSYFLDQKN